MFATRIEVVEFSLSDSQLNFVVLKIVNLLIVTVLPFYRLPFDGLSASSPAFFLCRRGAFLQHSVLCRGRLGKNYLQVHSRCVLVGGCYYDNCRLRRYEVHTDRKSTLCSCIVCICGGGGSQTNLYGRGSSTLK